MSNKRRTWIATPTESRIAWIVAAATVVVVVAVFFWPHAMTLGPETTVSTDPQPADDESIGEIIAKVQRTEKHTIRPQADTAPANDPQPAVKTQPKVTKPVPVIAEKPEPKPVAKAKPAPVVKHQAKPTSGLPKGYYVQVGAFSKQKGAETLASKMATHWITHIKSKSNKMLAVWIGPYASSKEAGKIKAEIASRTKIKGFIVKN
jgi:cell division septation protein DedD